MFIRRTLVAGLAAAGLILAGCSTGNDSGGDSGGDPAGGGQQTQEAADIRIDVITHGAPGDPFWDVVKSGAADAGNDLGVEVNYQSSPDPGEQSTLIDNAVAQGTDGIVVSMANPDALSASIMSAVEGGTPVITINSGIDEWKQFGALTHVGQSESLAGQAAGEQFNSEGATNAICVIHETGNIGLEQRCAGAAKTFTGTMTNLQVDINDLASAQSDIQAKLLQDRSIDAVLTLNTDVAGVAVDAVSSANSDAAIATFDVDDQVKQAIAQGAMQFAIDQQPYVQGYLGVTGIYLKVAKAATIGGGQPVYSGPTVLTKDDVQ